MAIRLPGGGRDADGFHRGAKSEETQGARHVGGTRKDHDSPDHSQAHGVTLGTCSSSPRKAVVKDARARALCVTHAGFSRLQSLGAADERPRSAAVPGGFASFGPWSFVNSRSLCFLSAALAPGVLFRSRSRTLILLSLSPVAQ